MFLFKNIRACLFILIGTIIIFSGQYNAVSAQTACDSASTSSAKEEDLKKNLEQCEKEIKAQDEILKSTKIQGVSISEDISILGAKIKKEQLNIKAKNILISGLFEDIAVKSEDIRSLEQKIQKGLDSIADLLKKTDQMDSSSFAEMMLSDKDLSQFFIDIDSFDSIKKSLKSLLGEIRETKDLTEKQKEYLIIKKDQETDAKMAIEMEKRKIEKYEKEKKELLNINKEQVKVYAQILKEKEKKAAKIRSALFALRDTAAIPFGKALEYANLASEKTGVRPAFLLAILTQESNLGENVGSCYLKNSTTGESVSMKSGKVFLNGMKPIRDTDLFLEIAKEAGRDPYSTPVSCPQAGIKGWGGAMGPAQFIPSTWQLFKERIASIVGNLIPNPWEPKDAIVASSLYLSDLGADKKSYSAEKKAACRYYGSGGSSCSYGNKVMARAQNIQETMIDFLQGN